MKVVADRGWSSTWTVRGSSLRRDQKRHPRLVGPVQGEPRSADDEAERARASDPPARRRRADDERRRRNLHSLDDAELALPALELQARLRSRRNGTGRTRSRTIRHRSTGRSTTTRSSRTTTSTSTWPASPASTETSKALSTRAATSSKARATGRTRTTAASTHRLHRHDLRGRKGGSDGIPIQDRPGFARGTTTASRSAAIAALSGWTGCWTNAKVSTNVDYIPLGDEDEEPQDLTTWRTPSASRSTPRAAPRACCS